MIDSIFEIPLPPRGKARPRASVGKNGKAFVFTPAETRRWEDAVAYAARLALGSVVVEGPLHVDVAIVAPRPQSMLRVGRDKKPKFPIGLIPCPQKPDLDNVLKSVLDGMRSCWRDDKQVVKANVLKFYAEASGRPRVMVRVRDAWIQAMQEEYYALFTNPNQAGDTP